MNKTLITIIGTTGSGKTTLSETLINAPGIKKAFPVLQLSCREPRHDDRESNLLKIVSPQEYKATEFISCYGDYGIPKYAFDSFFYSNEPLGVAIVSTQDVITLKKIINSYPYNNEIKIFNILLTLEETPKNELITLKKLIKQLFQLSDRLKRYQMQKQLIKKYFYSLEYIGSYVDLHLSKKNMSIFDYCKTIENYLEKQMVNLVHNEKALKTYINIVCEEGIKRRQLQSIY